MAFSFFNSQLTQCHVEHIDTDRVSPSLWETTRFYYSRFWGKRGGSIVRRQHGERRRAVVRICSVVRRVPWGERGDSRNILVRGNRWEEGGNDWKCHSVQQHMAACLCILLKVFFFGPHLWSWCHLRLFVLSPVSEYHRAPMRYNNSSIASHWMFPTSFSVSQAGISPRLVARLAPIIYYSNNLMPNLIVSFVLFASVLIHTLDSIFFPHNPNPGIPNDDILYHDNNKPKNKKPNSHLPRKPHISPTLALYHVRLKSNQFDNPYKEPPYHNHDQYNKDAQYQLGWYQGRGTDRPPQQHEQNPHVKPEAMWERSSLRAAWWENASSGDKNTNSETKCGTTNKGGTTRSTDQSDVATFVTFA